MSIKPFTLNYTQPNYTILLINYLKQHIYKLKPNYCYLLMNYCVVLQLRSRFRQRKGSILPIHQSRDENPKRFSG